VSISENCGLGASYERGVYARMEEPETAVPMKQAILKKLYADRIVELEGHNCAISTQSIRTTVISIPKIKVVVIKA
jgi:hypothetical protein